LRLNNYEIKGILKVVLLFFAFFIGFFSLWYTNNLVEKLAEREQEKIAAWADATRLIGTAEANVDVNFLFEIVEANTTIPVIVTNQKGEVTGHRNLDSSGYNGSDFMRTTIAHMKEQNDPIYIEVADGEPIILYYENSKLLNQLRVYPYFQLGVIALFLAMSYFAFSYSRTSEQNKVWAGMSKETAHQLGTPISSLMGWLDYIKEAEGKIPERVVKEMDHDLNRLGLITERFSKIGSEPALDKHDLFEVLDESVSYINKRTSEKVNITISNSDEMDQETIYVNKPLFAWVVENLCKNAVDAMEGVGSITFELQPGTEDKVILDVVDTGKGVPSNKFKTIFKPGYTTKKRGWGLGLSLVKRIIENYHKGKIYVKSSEIGKGTRFRIELPSH